MPHTYVYRFAFAVLSITALGSCGPTPDSTVQFGPAVTPQPQQQPQPQPQAAATADAALLATARAYFTDLDEATLRARGPLVQQIYGSDTRKLQTDIFNNVATWAQSEIMNDVLRVHGQTQGLRDTAAIRRQILTLDSTRTSPVSRLSTLQVTLLQKHFSVQGRVDYTKVANAYRLFANGQTRLTGPELQAARDQARAAGQDPDRVSNNEMDQMFQWLIWYKFAEICAVSNINAADWQAMQPILIESAEIYQRAYKARTPSAENGESPIGGLSTGADSFDPNARLSRPQMDALRRGGTTLERYNTILRTTTFNPADG